MTKITLLISLALLSGCGGAGKAAIDAGKGFDRFGCISRNMQGQSPCPASDQNMQNNQ